MPAIIIDDSEFVEALSRAGIEGVSPEDRGESIDNATDRVRQAALNWYTSASFESLTVNTTPAEMRGYALALALDDVTRSDAGRPDSIKEGLNAASRWLGFIAGGTTHYDESPSSVLVKITDTVVSSNAATGRTFDRSNSSQDYQNRNPKI